MIGVGKRARERDGGLVSEVGSPGRGVPKRYTEPNFPPTAAPRDPENWVERQEIMLEHGSSMKLCSVAFVREPCCAPRCRQVGIVNGTSMADDVRHKPK